VRRCAAILVLTIVATGLAPAAAQVPPVPDPGFIEQVPGGPCTPETAYEKQGWDKSASAQAGKACKRIHFTFGPITVKPGQNDVLLGPVTIEKPAYDGYITRFQPDLVDESGVAPPISVVHLHHATWLNAYPSYGNGPFFAAGEEKTILPFPRGYGMHVGADDTWLLLYMVHSEVATPKQVWITYDIDYVADADAEKIGIVPAKPIWLDVQSKPISKGAPDTGGNPVFNVQKGFGHYDKELGQMVCSWPRENCARHDVYGGVTPQQGKPVEVAGADWKVTKDMAGTLVTMGGHLHPGGLRDEVSLVRDGKEVPIHISDAIYWDRKYSGLDPITGEPERRATGRSGGPANSWDFSMTGTGAFLDWKVKIKKGDILRLNATYDSEHASWYENMGIVMAWVAPKDPHGPEGIDVFEDDVTIDPGVPTTAVAVPGWRKPTCTPDLDGPHKTLCLRGQITHGHLPEAEDFGGCLTHCQPLTKTEGPMVTDIAIAGFTYGQADLGMIDLNGIPRVKLGEPVTFWNLDTTGNVWHTVTRCATPCNGQTGLDYPIADGGVGSPKDVMDFDSTEIGYGVFFSPASGQLGDEDKSTEEALRDGMYWTFTPKETGVYTFFCRIHHGMRGAIEVVK
jgi:plastocyanin